MVVIAMTLDTDPSAARRAILAQLRLVTLQLEELDVTGRMRRKVLKAEAEALRERLAGLGSEGENDG